MRQNLAILCIMVNLLIIPHRGMSRGVLLNQDAGLKNIEVTAITKSQNGMMWVGTKRGLNKYDGYSFISIQYFTKQCINSLVYDAVRDVVWVGTNGGLYYLECKTNIVVECTRPNKWNAVSTIRMFRNKIIVAFQTKYVLQIDATFGTKVLYYFGADSKLYANKMDIDTNGNLYACLKPSNRIVRVSLNSFAVDTIATYPSRLIEILGTVNNRAYTGGINIGFRDAETGTATDWYFDSLNKVKQDPEYLLQYGQSLLVGYRNETRLYNVDLGKKSITDISRNERELFANKRVYCLYRDDFGVIWIGTSKGLIKLAPEKAKPDFERLLFNRETPVSTRQIVEDEDGAIYIASYAGFYTYNNKHKKWENYNTLNYLGVQQPFSQRSLLISGKRFVYIGSDANYFVRYNKQTRKIESLFYQSANQLCDAKGSILSMVQDTNGRIWLGTDSGLLSYDTVHSEITCHFNDRYSIKKASVKFIHLLPNKRQFWVGGEQGIFLVDIDKGVLLHLNENTVPALSNEHVNVITTDTKGNVWIGTDMGGINILSADGKSIYYITQNDGLSSNEVYNILWQDADRLWISTYNGLDYYHIPSKTIIPYYKEDGITNNEFNQNSALKAKDGKMYFGGIDGITAFYPPAINFHPTPFRVFVSAINVWDKKIEAYREVIAADENSIHIQPGDNLLTFSFAGTDYTAPELTTYFYKIEGLHSDWITLGTQPKLRLESLRGGEYQLMVKAVRGSRGVASQNILQYRLVVSQEFYRTIWFYVLLASVLAGIIYVYFRNRLNTQKKLELLRVKIASNLHDEVGSLLTRITMSADRLVTRMPRESETREKLEGVSALSRAANVAMSDVLWTIDARNDFAGSLTDRMREHAEDLLLPRGIDVTIDFNQIDQFKKLSPEYRQHLFLVYKEMINNIIKHSRATVVEIVYKEQGDQCILKVRNDGVKALGQDSVGTGQGLRNIKMRAELLKGKAEVRKEGDWFEVIVSV